MTDDELYDALVSAFDAFLTPLRMGASPDEDQYRHVLAALTLLMSELKGVAVVPKPVVRLLVDFHPQLCGIIASRGGADADTLLDWSVEIVDRMAAALDE